MTRIVTRWQDQAESAMVAILARAEDLASGCGDTKQLTDLGKMVGELVVAAETLRVGSGEKTNGKQHDEKDDEDD